MDEIIRIYKTLTDETRLRILALLLAAEGELCVCDIIAALKLPQPTVSRHLAHLRKAGWVIDRRCGLWVYYSLLEKDDRHEEIIPLLRKQLLNNKVFLADRETLADFSDDNRCA